MMHSLTRYRRLLGPSVLLLLAMLAVGDPRRASAPIASAALARVKPAVGVMGFEGEPTDNFWTLAARYCTDGISIAATQTSLSTQNLSFSVQLGAVTIPVQKTLPATIAQGDGSTLVNNSQSFLYQTAQVPGTPVNLTVQRWDHGNVPIDPLTGDESGPNTDGSIGDDIVSDAASPVVEGCLTGARIATSSLTCSSFTASGTAVLPNGYAGVRVWDDTTRAVLIDSYTNRGVPAIYAPIAADDTYSVTVSFPQQHRGSSLRARVYWAPAATFGSWDGGHFDEVTNTCAPPATPTSTPTATRTATTTPTTTSGPATATPTTTSGPATATPTSPQVPPGFHAFLPFVWR